MFQIKFRLDDVLVSAVSMGARVVRAHSLGVSTGRGAWHCRGEGWGGGVWPDRGNTSEQVLLASRQVSRYLLSVWPVCGAQEAMRAPCRGSTRWTGR